MNCEKIADFYQTRYRVKFSNYLQQNWKSGRVWDCLGAPKQEHLFLLFLRGGAVYTNGNGETVTVCKGELVYTPKGSEYSVRFSNDGGNVETLAIRFELFDEDGADIVMPDKVFRFSKNSGWELFFKEMETLVVAASKIPVKHDCVLYALISELGALDSAEISYQDRFRWIEKGIEYLTLHFNENVSVESLAEMCHISPVYFRKLFKQRTGISPVEYRTELRLKRAREHLLYGSDSVSEIAELLGYFSSAYFIKQFKEKYGCSPYAYRLEYKR